MQEYVCADGRMSVNGMCSIPNQSNNNITKDFSKDVKSNFQWDFDKVGDKVGDFNQTMKDGISTFDSYIQDNLGIKNVVKNIATGLALGPMAIPYAIGKNIFNQYQKNKNTQNYTNTDPQDDIVTYDMMTYGVPETNDTQTNNTQSTGREASYTNTASTGAKDGFGYGL